MTRRSRFPLSGLLFALLALLLLVPMLGSPAQADPSDPVDPDGAAVATPTEVAEQALETVQDVIDGTTPTPADPALPTADEAPDLTLALRDLMLTRENLPRSLRDDAARMLARPDGSGAGCDFNACYDVPEAAPQCGVRVCVHYVSTVASGSDQDDRASLTYVQRALDRLEHVAGTYVAAGYRPPVSDGTAGGGVGKVDVYLADLPGGLYGYCASDQGLFGHNTVAGYCVLDNDYRPGQYGSVNTPTENLEVTAAHEYFHAVQFAYDVGEATWFLESTATWAEDEIYDAVNDNRSYLPFGPLGKPGQPLGTSTNFNVYGAWIFIRYLSENYPSAQGGLPSIVAEMWLKAANSGPGAGGMTSQGAIQSALAARGTTFAAQFARFAVWNRRPAKFYEEGSAYNPAPPWKNWSLTPSSRSRSVTYTANRNAARHVRFTRSSAFSGTWKLRVSIDLNTPSTGGVAYVTIKPRTGAARSTLISLNSSGDASPTYWFGPKTAWVEITAVNASTADRTQKVSGRALR